MARHVVRSQGKGLDSRNCQMIFHWVSLNTFELILLCIRSPWPLHPATKIRKAKLYMVFHHMQASKLIWDDFGTTILGNFHIWNYYAPFSNTPLFDVVHLPVYQPGP
jgi:hypothetical protein